MHRLAAVLLVVAGCDDVFNLDTVGLHDASGFDAGSDSAVDAAPCMTDRTALVGSDIDAIAAGDMDGDGGDELAVASGSGSSASLVVFAGAADRTLAPGAPLMTDSQPVALAWYRPRGATASDLVESGRGNGVLLYYGSSGGQLGPPTGRTVIDPTAALTVADINGDTYPDIVAGADSMVNVFFGSQSGFGAAFIPEASASWVAAGELGGDASSDLAFARTGVAECDTYIGGATTLTSGPTVATGAAAAGIAIGDFNDDHVDDLAISVPSQNRIILAFGPAFTATMVTPHGTTGPLLAHELTGDDKLDLVVATLTGVVLLPGLGDGSFGAAQPLLASLKPIHELVEGDFDHDGHADFAAASADQIIVSYECQ